MEKAKAAIEVANIDLKICQRYLEVPGRLPRGFGDAANVKNETRSGECWGCWRDEVAHQRHFPYTSKYLLRRYLDPTNPPQTPSQKVLGGLGSTYYVCIYVLCLTTGPLCYHVETFDLQCDGVDGEEAAKTW